jgi:hypothetical protein
MLRWRRRGLLVSPRGDAAWSTHAQNPTALALSDDLWRIYFAGRDARNRATLFAADVDPRREMRVLALHDRPLLAPGVSGAFDEAGLGPACALRDGRRVLLYYAGVSAARDVPHRHAVGLAASDDGLRFERVTPDAVFASGSHDPYSVSVPFVRRARGGFEMWYHSTTGWYAHDGRREATYTIRRAFSPDGVAWAPVGADVVPPEHAATGSTRPWIAHDGSRARLWFSRRGTRFRDDAEDAYRLVSAPLNDDETALGDPPQPVRFTNPPQIGAWDGWMQAYASVVRADSRLVMFYNGDGFGRAGFGWAEARA